jgi:plastocyanin
VARARTSASLLAVTAAVLVVAAPAPAAPGPPPGVERLHLRYGPITIRPGTNLIKVANAPKPDRPGYVVRIAPNLRRVDGSIPPTDRMHLHHAVWLSTRTTDTTKPGIPERFFATGEEKTIVQLPSPYGYPVDPADSWILNYMIHDLTSNGARIYVTYDIDFVPANSPLGQSLRPARPVWMDVQNGSAYPVFDVLRRSGRGGRYTYPDQAIVPYGAGAPLNQWTVDRSTTLIAAAGHLHPGGLYDDLRVARDADSRLVFRSEARYFGNRPPVSWDLAMTATPPSWRVQLRAGDRLSVHATYDTTRASWYESMGIMMLWVADDAAGPDALAAGGPVSGAVTHGRLAENGNRGGTNTGIPDPARLPNGRAPGGRVSIGGFLYRFGDLHGFGAARNPPTIRAGQRLTYVNQDAPADVFHTVTACRAPCNRSTGIAFPLANGAPLFDSGQLGFGPRGFTAAANRDTWSTPVRLTPGTYTFYCRVHPFMRGAFRIVR